MSVSAALKRILKESAGRNSSLPSDPGGNAYNRMLQVSRSAYGSVPRSQSVPISRSSSRSRVTDDESYRDREERLEKERNFEYDKLDFKIEQAKRSEDLEAMKSVRNFRQDVYKEAFKQRGRLEGKRIDIDHKIEFESYKRELTSEDRFRKNRNDQILNELRRARTGEIITRPQMKRFESDLRRIEEGDKAKGRLDLERVRQENKLDIERFGYSEKIKLRAIEEGLRRTREGKEGKAKKESTSQEFRRMMKSGAFETVRDIARLGAEQKFKGAALREITELRSASLGLIVPLDAGWFSERELTDTEWEKWLGTSLPIPDIDNAEAAVRAVRGFGSREAAERRLIQKEIEKREQGKDENEIQREINDFLRVLSHAYPGDPSSYEIMKANNEDIRIQQEKMMPDTAQATGIISDQIRNIYDDILSGIDDKSSEGLSALDQIQNLIGDIQKTEGGRISEEKKKSRIRQSLGYSSEQERSNSEIDKENAAEEFWNEQRDKLEKIDTEEEFEGFKKEFFNKKRKRNKKKKWREE